MQSSRIILSFIWLVLQIELDMEGLQEEAIRLLYDNMWLLCLSVPLDAQCYLKDLAHEDQGMGLHYKVATAPEEPSTYCR